VAGAGLIYLVGLDRLGGQGWDGMEGTHLDDDDYSSLCAIVVPCIS
jgi:hypothetical protein